MSYSTTSMTTDLWIVLRSSLQSSTSRTLVLGECVSAVILASKQELRYFVYDEIAVKIW